MKTLVAFCAIAAAITYACPAGADDAAEKTPHRVPRVSSTVVIDGVLDDEVWEQALVMGVNTEVRPGENIPAPVETDMLLAYSETHFYVAFRAFDPDPSLIRANFTDHDRMWDDEFVVIGIDTYNDQRGGFEFACNPLGIQGETASGVHGDGNSWDAIWDSAGRITDWGYAVEMAIPFSSLRFQRSEGDQIWGVDAVRSYPRDVRHHISLYPRDRDNNCYYCQMEKLVGFAGATPGRNIEITPTVSAIASQVREGYTEGPYEDPADEYDVGVTARWGITPNVTMLATVNPDFSQVEADAFQLDVNRRYALSYPEKRPFFLEGAGTFGYFYTRSIADPIWGVKLTGKEGSNGVGVIVARDDVTNLVFPGSERSSSTSLDMETTATVVRYRRDVGRQSSVDLLYNGREGVEYYNRKWGAAGNFWLNDAAHIEATYLTSATSYPVSVAADFGQPSGEFSDDAFVVEVGHFTSGLDVYAEYGKFGNDFRTDLMYFPEVGFSTAEAGFGHTWNSGPDNWWTMLNFGSAYNHQEKEDGTLRSKNYRFWANYEGQRESFANLEGTFGTEAYSGEEFDTWEVDFEAGLWSTGSLFTMAEASYGEAIDYDNVRTGRRFELSPHIEAKIGRHLSVELSHTFERFDVDDGRLYTANVTYAKAVHQFTPRAFLRAILQYADSDLNADLYLDDVNPKYEGLSSQILFSYKINPQTVFFLGYSDSFYGDRDVDLIRTDRTLFAKIGYALVL
jgi:hypothetical protein